MRVRGGEGESEREEKVRVRGGREGESEGEEKVRVRGGR